MSEWWRGAVIYQIYPRSFQDSDGDGIGDLPGIRRRLRHVAELGADAVWISPFFPSPMKDMGYDVSDYTGVDPLFGTLEDFDALLAEAHGLGLRVIIDQVLSHTSDKHPWFVESAASREGPKADWYVWADPLPDGAPPNNWHSHFGGPAWEFSPRRGQYYLHNFLAAQPDLNFHNPAVQDALLDAVRFWLDRGVDGFRLDTVNYYFHDARLRSNPPNTGAGHLMATDLYGMQQHLYDKTRPENIGFLRRLRALCDEYPEIAMVGEVGEGGGRAIEVMAEYTRGSDRLHMAYSFALLGPEFSAGHVRRTVEAFRAGAPDGWPCWSFSNHDVERHVTRWAAHGASPEALARQCAALLMALPGTVGIYQGEELGQTETELSYDELTDPPALRFWPEVKGRDGCRTPMVWEAGAPHAGFTTGTPWLPVKPPQAARAVDAQGPGSVLEFYRRVLAARRASQALRLGEARFADLPEPLLALRREAGGGEAVTCVCNLSPTPARLRAENAAMGEISGAATLTGDALDLGPNGFAWLNDAGGAVRLTPLAQS